MKHTLYYLIGTTCSGKDYLAEAAEKDYPKTFGVVQVGKEMRRRHPPEYFRGLGAMPHTEDEAQNIYKEQLNSAKAAGKSKIIIVGQPRMKSQVNKVFLPNPGKVIWLNAADNVIKARIKERFVNDHAALDLANARVTNDKLQLFEVLFELLHLGTKIQCFNTDSIAVEELVRYLLDDQ